MHKQEYLIKCNTLNLSKIQKGLLDSLFQCITNYCYVHARSVCARVCVCVCVCLSSITSLQEVMCLRVLVILFVGFFVWLSAGNVTKMSWADLDIISMIAWQRDKVQLVEISSKRFHNWVSNVGNKPTDKQTSAGKRRYC